ncbi:MAG TPA: AAA family ATPase [Dehalococcoidia bacterium]|nr:AAA family ATPase [Dehalococcoidia bacterium]
MNFVFLYGPPGVGKLTVAGELASLTGYRLFDNHVSIDAVRRVFDFSDEPFWPLVLGFRLDMYEAAAKYGVDLIGTGAYVYPKDNEVAAQLFSRIEAHGARVCLVHLTCRTKVLAERVQSEERRLTKQTFLDKNDYFTPIPNRTSLRIDNSDLAPADVALQIATHYGLLP